MTAFIPTQLGVMLPSDINDLAAAGINDGDFAKRVGGAWVGAAVGGEPALLVESGAATKISALAELTVAANDDELVLVRAGANKKIDVANVAGLMKQSNGAVIGGDFTGNPRGTGAFDFQASRGSATQVASGNNSVICGGQSNTASNDYGVVCGGTNNANFGDRSFIGGGQGNYIPYDKVFGTIGGGIGNTASGNGGATVGGGSSNLASNYYTTVSGGLQSVSSGRYSTVVGGYSNTASGIGAVAVGMNAVASQMGKFALAGGRFSANGDAQVSIAQLRISTTNNTPAEMFTDGSAVRLVIPTNGLWEFVVHIIARQKTENRGAAFVRRGVISNDGGVVTLIGEVQTIGTDIQSAELVTTGVQITADDSNNALVITVTGVAATNLRWLAKVELVELSYP